MPDIKYQIQECVFAWDAAYLRKEMSILVRIKLIPDPAISDGSLLKLKMSWEAGIDAI